MKRIVISLFFVFGFIISNQELSAQFTCEGRVCSYLPSNITSPFNDTYAKFQTQYLNEVMKTNTEAGFLANIGASNIGTGTVRRIQIGASLSAAGYKKDDIQITGTDLTLPKLPNVGGSVVPSITLDINPGWLLGFDDRHWSRRFGIFLHGMNVAVSKNQLESLSNNKNYEGRITVKSYGGMLRYQLVEKTGFLQNLFTWEGINIGAGHHVMDERFSLSYLEGKAATIEMKGVSGKWGGDTNFHYNTKVRTTNVDVRTGIGLFWVANLIVGGGYSWNSGDSEISLSRTGPLLVNTSLANIVDIPREYQSQIDPALLSQSQSGVLGLTVSGNASSKRKIGYGVVGLELDIYLVKVVTEVIYGGKDLYSGNVGVKLSF
ncbi:Lsa36 family surface (lipo)protein [Leptospira idonii]|uniref:Autotransporter outer membrane beta-barrel domain-containing protein n=1 Tax=Leptospira idonii TaxID=1193500 RepID=A0A4R9M0K0_9LEPT|nr:hypothetical protein [Leptospira idonii]TGN19562.1 hypothetical protein EHS15_07175 [Leptospira idonii]